MPSIDLIYHPLTQEESSRINAIRGVLCFEVFVFHYYESLMKPMGEEIWSGFRVIGTQGYLAVLVFFVISGFLISMSYAKEEAQSPFSWKIFYIKRFFRIFPAWFVALSVYCYYLGKTSISEFLWNFFLLFGLKSPHYSELIVPHSWTLFVEEVFYLSFPIWSFLIRRQLALYAVCVFAALKFFLDPMLVVEPGYYPVNPLLQFLYFAVGVALYLALPYVRKLSDSRVLFYVFSAGAVGLTMIYGSERPLPWVYISFAVVYIFAAPMEAAKVFNFVFERLGKYCYSFYLVHMMGIFVAPNLANKILESFAPLSTVEFVVSTFWISLLLTLGMALLLYHLIERPVILLAKRKLIGSS